MNFADDVLLLCMYHVATTAEEEEAKDEGDRQKAASAGTKTCLTGA